MDLSIRGDENRLLLTRLRATERFRNTAIIALTANVTSVDRMRALTAGHDEVLGQPFDRDQLFAIIERAISKHKGGADGDQDGRGTDHKSEAFSG